MIKAIASESFKISKKKDCGEDVYRIEVTETGCYVDIYKEELDELVELLKMVKGIL